MSRVERGLPLVEQIISQLEPHIQPVGATAGTLDAIESRLMVELPPTLRRFLQFDFGFTSFGSRWRGRRRFGKDPSDPKPRITSLNKLAEAMTELGWTNTRLRHRVVRLPNLPGEPWNCLYLGEARRDGELPILALVNDETNVGVYLRYTSFDLYLVEQSGLADLDDATRLEDVESLLSLNPELGPLVAEDDYDSDY